MLKSRNKDYRRFFLKVKNGNRTFPYLVAVQRFLVILGEKVSKGHSEREAGRFSEAKGAEKGRKAVSHRVRWRGSHTRTAL